MSTLFLVSFPLEDRGILSASIPPAVPQKQFLRHDAERDNQTRTRPTRGTETPKQTRKERKVNDVEVGGAGRVSILCSPVIVSTTRQLLLKRGRGTQKAAKAKTTPLLDSAALSREH